MQIDILTIFPEMFTGTLQASILGRAQAERKVQIRVHDLRNWTGDVHRTVDDRPYGGGPGMVMMIEPIDKALSDIVDSNLADRRTVLTSASGKTYTQQTALSYSKLDQLVIIAGHYEGVDQRVADHLCDEEVSIGPYVLTGGELPAMVIADSVTRLLPGVLGSEESLAEESHTAPGTLEYPHYTRPESYKDLSVPDVLLSGNHAAIAAWRAEQSKKRSR